MRRHGWSGDMPRDDDEARERIVTAAAAAMETHPGRPPSITAVAERLGVSRQTVYRYYSSSHALLIAVVGDVIDQFLDDIAVHLGSITVAADAVVEGLAYTFEQIQERPDLGLVLSTDGSARLVTSASGRLLGRAIVERFPVDWAAAGFGGPGDLDDLVELMLRLLQSFVIDPGDPPRSPAELRRYLERWLGRAVAASD